MRFIPPPQALPSIPIAPASFDWDSVESIADKYGLSYDAEIGRYRDSNGKVLSEEIMLQILQAELAGFEADIDKITQELIDSQNVIEWEKRIAELVIVATLVFFLFGLGDREYLTDEHDTYLRDKINTQYKFLRQFSQDILAGRLSELAINARSDLYVHDAESRFAEGQEFGHDIDEWPYYSNVLGPCLHCAECPTLTSLGIVPRGTMPAIGDRECKWRCCCRWAFYRSDNERQRQSLTRSAWGSGSLSMSGSAITDTLLVF